MPFPTLPSVLPQYSHQRQIPILNKHPLCFLIITRSTLGERFGILGYDIAGLTFANRSYSRRKTRITSAALSPTGPFKHTCDFCIISALHLGRALPYLAKVSSPASAFLIVNLVLLLSFMV